jgi:hypothetical protein
MAIGPLWLQLDSVVVYPAVPFTQRGNAFDAFLSYERTHKHSDVLVCRHTSLIGTIRRAASLMHPRVLITYTCCKQSANMSFRLRPFIGVYFSLDLEFRRHLPRPPTPSTSPIHWRLSQT